jgi:hypothetical protein
VPKAEKRKVQAGGQQLVIVGQKMGKSSTCRGMKLTKSSLTPRIKKWDLLPCLGNPVWPVTALASRLWQK